MPPVALAVLQLLILGAFVCAARRSLLGGLTPISVFIVTWLVFNYVGMVLAVFSPQLIIDYWPGFDFSYYGPEQATRMLWATNIGLLCILIGALFALQVLGRGKLARSRPYPLVVVNTPLALTSLAILSLWAGVRLYIDYAGNIPVFVLFTAGFAEAYWYRTSEILVSQLWVYISWSIIPFLSAYVVVYAVAMRKQLRWYFLGTLALANGSFFLLSLLHKRGFVIWLAGLALAIYMISERRAAARFWWKLRKGLLWSGAVFLTLSLLFALFSTSQDGSLRLGWAAETAFMELIFRGTLSAIFYFSLVPEFVPFHEFGNIGIFSRLMGQDVGASDTQIIFGYVMRARGDNASISSHLITDFYGAYGYSSLIVGCLFAGLFLGLMTNVYKKMPNVPHYVVMKVGMLLFSINICSGSFFQSLAGYGLIFYLVTWSFLHAFTRKKIAADGRQMRAPPILGVPV